MHLDKPYLTHCGDMLLGCYGGNVESGAYKNEDGALLLCSSDESWHFAALCDAHVTSQSAELVLRSIESVRSSIVAALSQPSPLAFPILHQLIITLLRSEDFRKQCRTVSGETACLICAQKDQYLWWLSVGDCLVYLFHPHLAQLGQYTLNHRNFYEWIGQINTFDLPIPCFASGVRELRQGPNHIMMVTDGLLECGSRPFEDSRRLYDLIMGNGDYHDRPSQERVAQALARVHNEQGRDSATIIYWSYDSNYPCAYPTG